MFHLKWFFIYILCVCALRISFIYLLSKPSTEGYIYIFTYALSRVIYLQFVKGKKFKNFSLFFVITCSIHIRNTHKHIFINYCVLIYNVDKDCDWVCSRYYVQKIGISFLFCYYVWSSHSYIYKSKKKKKIALHNNTTFIDCNMNIEIKCTIHGHMASHQWRSTN